MMMCNDAFGPNTYLAVTISKLVIRNYFTEGSEDSLVKTIKNKK